MRKSILFIVLLVIGLLPLGAAFAQEGGAVYFDTDGDGYHDTFDACPSEYGTEDDVFFGALPGCPYVGQWEDDDGDGAYNVDDHCPTLWADIGAPFAPWIGDPFFGCPDSDNDGAPDLGDACPYEALTPHALYPQADSGFAYYGCPDSDADLVVDHIDQCPYEAWEVEASNTGLPLGCPVTPDPIVCTSVVHVVQRGETLARLARRYGVTVNAIATTNNIRNINRINAGQRLIIPCR